MPSLLKKVSKFVPSSSVTVSLFSADDEEEDEGEGNEGGEEHLDGIKVTLR